MRAIDTPKAISSEEALDIMARSLNPPNDANKKQKAANTIIAIWGVMYLI